MLVQNRSVAIQLWAIGSLVPVVFFFLGNPNQRDFGILWAAAAHVLAGDAASIYRADIVSILPGGLTWGDDAVFPYPPHATFLFLPFALLSPFHGFLAWDAVSIVLFYWAARPYIPRGFPPILAVLTPASLICLDFGQTGLLLGAFWLLAFRGKWAAVALLTFKPHLGFLSILSIRSRAALIRVVILALVLVVASAILFGPGLWTGFVEQVAGQGARIGSMKRWVLTGVGPAIGYGFWGWIPFAAAGALMLARNVNVFTASTASFLISPYGFNYDMTVASLGFGLAIASYWHEMPVRDRIPMAIGFLSPVIAVGGTWWVPPLLLWALWSQTLYHVEAPGAGKANRPLR